MIIPPTKIVDRGRERTDVLELIWSNVRFQEGVRIDNAALMAALSICERRLLALVDKYGRQVVLACVDEMLDRTERAVREQIAAIPDGTYCGE